MSAHGDLSLYAYERAVAAHLHRTFGLSEGRARTMAGSEPGYLVYARGRHMSPGVVASAIAAKHHNYGGMKLGLRKLGNRDSDAVVIEPIADGRRGYFVRSDDLRGSGLSFSSLEAARHHAHSIARGRPVVDLAARRRHLMSAPRLRTRTRTRFGNVTGQIVARSYYHGQEVEAVEMGGRYYARVNGSKAFASPPKFTTIREAIERGKRFIDETYPANYRRRPRRNNRTGRFTRAR